MEITRELLRKRAEHNEGMLSTLEEVTLHQQDLKKISNLDVYCRHLKILYLQNNLIEKIEGLNKLKELEYLNMAVNSVSMIEGIRNCESLQKIDMTLNFIDVEHIKDSCENMACCPDLCDLYMTGNPCDVNWKSCKDYCIAKVKTLTKYNGEDITKSERLEAIANLKEMEQELAILAKESAEKKEFERKEGKHNPDAWNAENRWADYCEMQEKKEQDEKKRKEGSMFKEWNEMYQDEKNKPPPSVYTDAGAIRQCNQGGYEWTFQESKDKTALIFEINVPKFMDTSLLNVDLQPHYIRIDVRGKITQLRIPEEIFVEKSKVQRSQTTGMLSITMPLARINEIEAQKMRLKVRAEEMDKEKTLKELEEKQQKAKQQMQQQKINDQHIKVVEAQSKEAAKKQDKEEEPFEPDFDLDDLPDLE